MQTVDITGTLKFVYLAVMITPLLYCQSVERKVCTAVWYTLSSCSSCSQYWHAQYQILRYVAQYLC